MTRIVQFFSRVLFALFFVIFFGYLFTMYQSFEQMQTRIDHLEKMNAILLSASCQDINMHSRQPQQLSYDECMRYFNEVFFDMHKMPTATPLERQTSRPGLSIIQTPSPTPCDPHTTLCTRIPRR